MSTQSKRIVRAYLLLFVLLAALSFLSLAVGSVRVSAADILAALGGKEGTDMTRHILFDIRLPRMLGALILGRYRCRVSCCRQFSRIPSPAPSSLESLPEQSSSFRSS